MTTLYIILAYIAPALFATDPVTQAVMATAGAAAGAVVWALGV